jgi:hypothetical protein
MLGDTVTTGEGDVTVGETVTWDLLNKLLQVHHFYGVLLDSEFCWLLSSMILFRSYDCFPCSYKRLKLPLCSVAYGLLWWDVHPSTMIPLVSLVYHDR